MAEMIRTLKESGGDYATLTAWETATDIDISAIATISGAVTAGDTSITMSTAAPFADVWEIGDVIVLDPDTTDEAVTVTSVAGAVLGVQGSGGAGVLNSYAGGEDVGSSPVLEVYAHSTAYSTGNVLATGATGQGAGQFRRIIRAAAGEGYPILTHTGAGGPTLELSEPYIQAQHLTLRLDGNSAGTLTAGRVGALADQAAFVDCICDQFDNVGAGVGVAFSVLGLNSVGVKNFCVNCLVYGATANATRCFDAGWVVNAVPYLLNCTAYGNGSNTTGYRSGVVGVPIAKNCISTNMSANIYTGTWDETNSSNNQADSGNPPGSSDAVGTPTFVDVATNDFHLHRTDTVCRGLGADLSAYAPYPFNTDIEAKVRSAPWDIGAYKFQGSLHVVRSSSSNSGRAR